MTIKIEKNVPIPAISRATSHDKLNEIKKLEVDDSFLVYNPDNLPLHKLRNQTNSKMTYYGKVLNYKFTIRNTEEGLRVWRVK